MKATATTKEVFVDPVCGMTVDPGRAAGTSERDGVRYYFCSPGCKAKFDAGVSVADASGQGSCCAPAAPDAETEQGSCCGGSAAATPVQLTSSRQTADTGGAHSEEHHAPPHTRIMKRRRRLPPVGAKRATPE